MAESALSGIKDRRVPNWRANSNVSSLFPTLEVLAGPKMDEFRKGWQVNLDTYKIRSIATQCTAFPHVVLGIVPVAGC